MRPMRRITEGLSRMRASSLLLALLLTAGCKVGEPLVTSFPAVVPAPPMVPPCRERSFLCMTPPPMTNAAVTSRALGLSPCVPADPPDSVDEGDALASCAEPPAGVSWLNADVLVTADEPREIVLSDVDVVNMRIRLDGPVTLVFREPRQLTNVEIATTSPEAAVVFDHASAVLVTLGDESTPFAGHVEARHSRFDQLSMVAQSFELDSAMITESFVAADSLNSGDGRFRDAVLDLGDALFAPSDIGESRIVSCRTLAFFGGKLTSSLVPRCEGDEPTRIYDVEVEGGVIDGSILGEGGTWKRVQLGRHDPSDFVLWGVPVFDGSMFCDLALRLKSTDNVRCSDCTEAAFGAPVDDTCNLEPPAEEGTDADQNVCVALDLKTQCTSPVPDRLRPIADYWIYAL